MATFNSERNSEVERHKLITNRQYFYDEKLVFFPNKPEFATPPNTNAKSVFPSTIYKVPSPEEFVLFAASAYHNHHVDLVEQQQPASRVFQLSLNLVNYILWSLHCTYGIPHFGSMSNGTPIQSPLVHDLKRQGFILLACGRNTSIFNGYYGVAFINWERRQIVVSHRGTKPLCIGAWTTNFKAICGNYSAPQVSSAITFAHEIQKFADKHHCDLFFTGHSLGAWLAQITCFTTAHLTLNTNGFFVRKMDNTKHISYSYTVVFDSPGAYEFLQKIKRDLFPRNETESHELNVSLLPVEVYLFHPNVVNSHKNAIGSVYLLHRPQGQSQTAGFLGITSHMIKPIVELAESKKGEEFVRCRVVDFRVSWREWLTTTWNESGKTETFNFKKFSVHLFNRQEQIYLKTHKELYNKGGQFEGIYKRDEIIANEVFKKDDNWSFSDKDNCSEVTTRLWDKQEFISNVRHTVRCILNELVWWNPIKSELPDNYTDRWAESKEIEEVEKITFLDAVEQEKNLLLLLVGSPGEGKSSVVTKLEDGWRTNQDGPRIIVRLNLNQSESVLNQLFRDGHEQFNQMCASDLISYFLDFIQFEKLKKHTAVCGSVPMYVILDGLDEVCPDYKEIMENVLNVLLASNNFQGKINIKKVVLTTRPHLQSFIQNKFKVKPHHLIPFTEDEQAAYLKKQCGELKFKTIEEAKKTLWKLPSTVRSLTKNPLMLSLYAEVIISNGYDLSEALDVLELYDRFMAAKHEHYLKDKLHVGPEKTRLNADVVCMLQDNLKYYRFCAVKQILKNSTIHAEDDVFFEKPTGDKLDILLSYGLIQRHGKKTITFKHKSFAEYFCSGIITDESISQSTREFLFGKMFDNDLPDLEMFVCTSLSKKPKESMEQLITSNHWLETVKYKTMAVDKILRWKMNDMLSERIFTKALNYQAPDVMLALIDNSYYAGNFSEWLLQTTAHEWARENIFGLKNSTTNTNDVSLRSMSQLQMELVVALTVFSPNNVLQNILFENEITSAQILCDGVVEVACGFRYADTTDAEYERPSSKKSLQLLEKLHTRYPDTVKRSMMCHVESDFFGFVVKDFEMSWFYVKVLSKNELFSIIAKKQSRVSTIAGELPEYVGRSWGMEFLGDLSLGLIYKDSYQVYIERWWKIIVQEIADISRGSKRKKEAITALQESIIAEWGIGVSILKYLEYRENQQLTCVQNDAFSGPQIVKCIIHLSKIGGTQEYLWDRMNKINHQYLMYVVRYGKLEHIERLLTGTQNELNSFCSDDELASALLLSLYVNRNQSTSYYSVITTYYTKLPSPSLNRMLHLLMTSSESNLLPLLPETGDLSNIPLLKEVPLGEVILKLLKKSDHAKLSEILSSEFECEWLVKCTLKQTQVDKIFNVLLAIEELYAINKTLFENTLSFDSVLETIISIAKFTNADKPKETKTGWLQQVLRFYLRVFGVKEFPWAIKDLTNFDDEYESLLIRIPVEVFTVLQNLSEETQENSSQIDTQSIASLVEQFKSMVPRSIHPGGTRTYTLDTLHETFHYKNEDEWEELLTILGIINIKNDADNSSRCKINHVHSVTPLLRVWAKHFGKDQTRNAADKDRMWDGYVDKAYCGELLHVAVEIGSLLGVRTLGWPGFLRWKNHDGHTALHVARATYEVGHPIRKFLEENEVLIVHFEREQIDEEE